MPPTSAPAQTFISPVLEDAQITGYRVGLESWRERAEVLLSHEISFVANEAFSMISEEAGEAEGKQLAAELQAATPGKRIAGLPPHYQRMCETPLLNARLEQACFRQMNWLKYRANVRRSAIDPKVVTSAAVLAVERMLQAADELRNYIVRANCRLAMSIVKNYTDPRNTFEELLSEGILTMVGAVEKFDYDRGFRFSTYATQSIRRRLFRVLSQRHKQQARFVTGNTAALEETLSAIDPCVTRNLSQGQMLVERLLSHLGQRERLILEARYGLHHSCEKQTFVEIGQRLSISKERVRQLAERALLRLQSLAAELGMESACGF